MTTAAVAIEVRFRPTDGSGAWSAPQRFGVTDTILLRDVQRDTSYDYEARAVSNCGAKSNWVTITKIIDAANLLPIGIATLSASSVADGVHLAWTLAPGSLPADVEFSVERSSNGTSGWVERNRVKTLAYTDPETSGAEYYYRVRAVNYSDKFGPYSAVVSAGGRMVVQTFYQDEAPSSSGLSVGDLWFDTDDGNHPYRWSGSAWVSVQDGDISAAATSASSALSAANNAMTAAQAAQATADGAIRTYYQSSAPTGLNSTTDLGDLWFDTDTNQAHRWNGSSWVLIEDNTIAQALAAAQSAQTTADGKITAYYQTSAPTSGMGTGDLWYDTNDDNKPYYYTGTVWTSIRDGTIGKVFHQASPPTPTSNNDMWFDSDDNNCPYVASGSSWINVRDGTILQAANNANDARSIANTAKTAAENAQSTADSKVSPGDSITVLGGRTADNIGETSTRKWAGESGADVTRTNASWGDNVIVNPNCDTGSVDPHFTNAGGGKFQAAWFDVTTQNAPGSSNAFAYVPDGQTGNAYIWFNGQSYSDTSGQAPCDAGEVWYASLWIREAVSVGTGLFEIDFRAADGTYLSTGGASKAFSFNNGQVLTILGKAPAGTAYATLKLTIHNDVSTTSSNWIIFQCVTLRKATVADADSGITVGDQRNLLPITFAGISSMPTSQPIAFSISGTTITFTVAAFTLNAGGITVSYSASSLTRGDQSAGTTRTYYLFYQDPGLSGGSKTLNVTVYLSTLAASPYNVFIGSCVVTIAAGGGGSSGGGGGGGGVLLPPGSGDYPIP